MLSFTNLLVVTAIAFAAPLLLGLFRHFGLPRTLPVDLGDGRS